MTRAYSYNSKKSVKKNHHNQIIRKQMAIIFICLITLGISLILLFGVVRSGRATATSVYNETVCYKSVQVEDGDTLWTLADEYMDHSFADKDEFIEEVKDINHIEGDYSIQSGSYILIPYMEYTK